MTNEWTEEIDRLRAENAALRAELADYGETVMKLRARLERLENVGRELLDHGPCGEDDCPVFHKLQDVLDAGKERPIKVEHLKLAPKKTGDTEDKWS